MNSEQKDTLTVLAPAKINLTLEVLGKRADGYHEIRSLMQTISLCDKLTFQPSEKVDYRSDSPEWVAEKSLVSKTVRLLQESTCCSKGAIITMDKHIPLAGGLGGESSDAAETLKGLDHLWKLGLPRRRLLELAWQLGSDVAFFLDGGTALVEGRGEIVTPLPSLPQMWVVLVSPDMPQLPQKTRQLYERLSAGHYTDGAVTKRLVAELTGGKGFSPDRLFNIFENVAFAVFPGLSVYREQMTECGAPEVHLAGSGPALFALLKQPTQAEKLYSRLNLQKIRTFLAETCPGNL